MAGKRNIRDSMVGMKTGVADGHPHTLLADGTTSPGPKDKHTHSWKPGDSHTSQDGTNPHRHTLPR